MKTLRIGNIGDEVRAWEHFLIGINPKSQVVADGVFDLTTHEETVTFQLKVGFTGTSLDGVVGPMTYGKAMQLGFDPTSDDDMSRFGPNWPAKPTNAKPMSPVDRMKTFGSFLYLPAPTPGNPEGIIITDGWDKKNITTITVPQLKNVQGSNGRVQVNVKLVDRMQGLFETWEKNKLMDRVLTWGGCWAPRFVRGSRSALSNHAWGTAFDINVQWNMLGTRPALAGDKGCVRELVEIAYVHGFWWGGWGWASQSGNGTIGRLDGMHMESFQ